MGRSIKCRRRDCPVCLRRVTINVSGKVHRHKVLFGDKAGEWCTGAGMQVEEI